MHWNKQNNVQKLRIIIHGPSTKKNRVRETFKLEDRDLQILRPETKKILEVLAKTDRVFGHKSFDLVKCVRDETEKSVSWQTVTRTPGFIARSKEGTLFSTWQRPIDLNSLGTWMDATFTW
jgi:hypothetical protein